MATYGLARVFGEAHLRVEVEEGGKPSIGLACEGYRGYEIIGAGCHGEFLPDLLSRRCGVDSLYHRMAACLAMEKALGVEVPESAERVRELLLACQLFRRHSLTMTLHVLPDLLFPASDPGVRNLVGLFRVDRDVVGRMMALNSWGESVLRAISARAVHPLTPVPGGLSFIPGEEAIDWLRNSIPEMMGLARETSRLVRMLLRRNEDLVGELEMQDGSQMAAETPPFGDSWVGVNIAEFTGERRKIGAQDLLERAEKVSLSDTLLEGYRVSGDGYGILTGPLSRINVMGSYGTEMADSELEEIKKVWGFPFRGILLSHALRLAEMIMALEKVTGLISEADSWGRGESRNEVPRGSGEGVVALEGAEGLHLLKVKVEEGYVSCIEYVAPLQWNLVGMLDMLEREGQKVGEDTGEARWLSRLEVAVRAYAPCFFCAAG